MAMLDDRPGRGRTTTCANCHAVYAAHDWVALRLLERLHRDELRHLVSEWPWPVDAHLEVRRCSCGQTVARLHA